MRNSIIWRRYVKGNSIPSDALRLGGYFMDHGPLYVGRCGENGEVGKLNIDGGNMKYLWTHAQGRLTQGEILCGSPDAVKWISYVKGDPVPVDAIKAGYYYKDGDLYIGRASNGEIGKINIEADKLNNLWPHASGFFFPHNSGEILCAVPEIVGIVYKLSPIYAVEGGASGYFDKQVTIDSGLSGSSKIVVNVTDISSKASLKWTNISASGQMDADVKSQMSEACSAHYENRKETNTIHVDLSKPCYVYQAGVIAKLSNGTEISMKHDAFIQKNAPILKTVYELDI